MKIRSWRVMAVVPALAASALGVVALASPAAAAGCTDGSRADAAALAAAGRFTEPKVASWFSSNGTLFTVTLRYDPPTRCVWGLIRANRLDNRPASYIWIDRSKDGGKTYTGLLGYRQLPGNGPIITGETYTTYTGTFNDAGMVSRVCGKDAVANKAHCSGWW